MGLVKNYAQIWVRINSIDDLMALDKTPIRWNSGPKPSGFIPDGIKLIAFFGQEDELFCSLKSPVYKRMKFSTNENPPEPTGKYPVTTFDSIYDFLNTIDPGIYSCEIEDIEQDVMSLI